MLRSPMYPLHAMCEYMQVVILCQVPTVHILLLVVC